MGGFLLQLAGSAVAVGALMAFAHWLGFSSEAKLSDEAEARALFQLMAGGFDPLEIAIDAHGCGAIARNAAGALAVLRPHGGRFMSQKLPLQAQLSAQDGALHIYTVPPLELHLGEEAARWAESWVHAANPAI